MFSSSNRQVEQHVPSRITEDIFAELVEEICSALAIAYNAPNQPRIRKSGAHRTHQFPVPSALIEVILVGTGVKLK